MSAPAAFGGFNVYDPNVGSASSAALDLYVSGDNGNDANPGTIALPLATVVEAERRIADILSEDTHRVIIHVGALTGSNYVLPTFRARLLRADIYVFGDGASQPGEDGFTALAGVGSSGTGDPILSTDEALVFAAGGMTIDAFRGRWVQITSGAASGDVRLIATNSTTTFIPARPFTASVVGATYRVVEPAAIFDAPDGEQVLVEGGTIAGLQAQTTAVGTRGTPCHNFINFGIDASGIGGSLSTIICQGPTNFFGIDTSFDPQRINVNMHGGTVGSTENANFASPSLNLVTDGLVASLSSWDGFGWGASTADASFMEFTNLSDVYEGLDPIAMAIVGVGSVFAVGDALITGGSFRRTIASLNSPLILLGRSAIVGATATLPVFVEAVSIGVSVGSRTEGANLQQSGGFRNVLIGASGAGVGVGVLLDGLAIFQAGHSIITDFLGVQARRGSGTFAVAPAIFATTADLSFDGVTGISDSLLAAADDLIDGGDVHFRRV